MKAQLRAVLLFVATVCAAQVGDRQQEVLAKVRATAGQALNSLPSYVCVETTVRLRAPKLASLQAARRIDTIELEVARIGDKEMYSLPGRNMFADTQLNEVVASGLVGTGTYASHLIDVLYGPGTQFRKAEETTLDGHAVLRWDFTVPRDSSNWMVSSQKRSVRAGSEGSLWVDATSLAILRLVCHAISLPAHFPIKSAARTIDYGMVRIGGREVMLATAAEDVMEYSGGVNLNRSRFGHCREFSADSTITFPQAEVPPPPELAAQPTASRLTTTLPKGLWIPLALDQHLRSVDPVIGSVITARVRSDVRRGGTVLIPKGTPIRGMLRDFQKVKEGYSSYLFVVTIEFNEIDLPGGTVSFDAFLKSVDEPVTGLYWLIPAEKGTMRSATFGPRGSDDSGDRIKQQAQPGRAVLLFRSHDGFDLAPGTTMTWTTVESESAAN